MIEFRGLLKARPRTIFLVFLGLLTMILAWRWGFREWNFRSLANTPTATLSRPIVDPENNEVSASWAVSDLERLRDFLYEENIRLKNQSVVGNRVDPNVYQQIRENSDRYLLTLAHLKEKKSIRPQDLFTEYLKAFSDPNLTPPGITVRSTLETSLNRDPEFKRQCWDQIESLPSMIIQSCLRTLFKTSLSELESLRRTSSETSKSINLIGLIELNRKVRKCQPVTIPELSSVFAALRSPSGELSRWLVPRLHPWPADLKRQMIRQIPVNSEDRVSLMMKINDLSSAGRLCPVTLMPSRTQI